MKFLKLLIVLGVVGFVLYFPAKRYLLPNDNNVTFDSNGNVVLVPTFDDSAPAFVEPETGGVLPKNYVVKKVVGDLRVPWSIVFTSENRLLVTERVGDIRVIEDGVLLPDPLITFSEVSSTAEEGLMGMALDPEYKNNKLFYVSFAYDRGGALVDKVVKLKDNGDSAEVIETVIDNIPAAKFHAGSAIKFGPDGYLYITTGDATDKNIAQNIGSLGGKILRISADGSVPADNPFEGSYVYSLGHRNPQGIDWSVDGDVMYSTEHGPSVFDGPAGGDEVNVIKAGFNYGWPIVSHENSREGLENPKLVFTPAVAPGSALLYKGDLFPQFTGNLFFGGLKGEGVYRVVFGEDKETVVFFEKLKDVSFGRIRALAESPSGEIWFSTSNRDGRGEPAEGDDTIYKLTIE